MLKLTGFEAQCEIQGRVVTARYLGGELAIQGLDLAAAKDVLDTLSTGRIRASGAEIPIVEKEGASHDTPRPATEEQPQAKSTKPRRKRKKKTNGKAAPPPEPDYQPALEGTDIPEQQQLFGTLENPNPAPKGAPVVEEAPVEQEAATSEESAPLDSAELPEELTSAVRLRSVLGYLLDNGFDADVMSLTMECERIKKQVPVLSRITNLQERISRTISVMDVGQNLDLD